MSLSERPADHVVVQAVDPATMVALTGLDAMEPVAEQATRLLDAALTVLAEERGGGHSYELE